MTGCKGDVASPPLDIPQPSPTLGGCVPQTVQGCGGSPLKIIQKVHRIQFQNNACPEHECTSYIVF